MRKTISIGDVNIGSAYEIIGPDDSIRVFIWDRQIRRIFGIPDNQKVEYKHGPNNNEF